MIDISYDADGRPVPPSAEVIASARSAGLIQIQILCEEPESESGDPTGASFWAFVPSLPRIGEEIWLEDNSRLTVTNVVHNVFASGEPGFIMGQPIVIAKKMLDEEAGAN